MTSTDTNTRALNLELDGGKTPAEHATDAERRALGVASIDATAEIDRRLAQARAEGVDLDAAKKGDTSARVALLRYGVAVARKEQRGEFALIAGGAEGWYRGDEVHETGAEGIGGTEQESAVERAMRLFGLDYTVEKRRTKRPANDGTLVDSDAYSTVRTDTDSELGIGRSERYGVVQNRDAFALMGEALKGTGYEIDRGGVFERGAVAWLQTRGTTIDTPAGKAECRWMVSNAHDGSGATIYTPCLEVVICRNLYRSIERYAKRLAKGKTKMASVRIKHTANAAQRVEQLRRTFEASQRIFGQAAAGMMALARQEVTEAQVLSLCRALFKADPGSPAQTLAGDGWAGREGRKVERFFEVYRSGPGAQPGTAWGLLQAVTRYACHEYKTRGSKADAHTMHGQTQGWTPAQWGSVWTGHAGRMEDTAIKHLQVHVLAG